MDVFLGGQVLFSVADASHTSGKVALYKYGITGAQFDDVGGRSIAELPPFV